MKTVILFFLLVIVSQAGYSQTETPEQQSEQYPETEQQDQNSDQNTDQGMDQNTDQSYDESYDVQPESVQMAEPSENQGYVNSPGHSSGYRTETIRYYSGSHNGNNVTKTVEVPLPEESTTQSPY